MKTDTIAAIATALSDSGIGIVRISGSQALEIADRIFRTKSNKRILLEVPSHTIHYGYIISNLFNENYNILDEVMIAVMKAPRSYTTEDTVEIYCHGGVLVTQKILEEALKAGAVLAQPGEFTKRAFLNGRIDLSKAEAVMDLIHSQNEYALKSSVSQLRGNLSDEVKSLRGDILYEIAFIESALDDPEHVSLDGYSKRLQEKLQNLSKRVEKLLSTADNGRLMKEGISTVIVGKPNVGKSSLMNLLVGKERAIVTDIAGTTRDILEEHIMLHGISLNVIDTAGIRDTEDAVEKIGVERAKTYAKDADLVVYVVDASKKLDEDDREIISMISNKNVVVLLNKTDLENVVTEKEIENLFYDSKNILNNNLDNINYQHTLKIIRTSATEQVGLELFEDAVKEMFFRGDIQSSNEIVITNLRHKEALQSALESLKLVEKSIADGMEEDFYSIDLMSAYKELGKIIGEEVGDDLVEEIFSRFCMGK